MCVCGGGGGFSTLGNGRCVGGTVHLEMTSVCVCVGGGSVHLEVSDVSRAVITTIL